LKCLNKKILDLTQKAKDLLDTVFKVYKNQKEQTKGMSNLHRFRQLRSNSNNTTKLTMDMATNTSEMVNDGPF